MVVVNNFVLSLIKKGLSLNKISKITGLGKSTLYFHYKKIKGRKIPLVRINFSNKNELGEFLGIFAGDGNFYKRQKTYHYTIRFFTGYYEKSYAKYLKIKFLEWFSKKPQVYFTYFNGRKSMIVLGYHSKEIYQLIKTYLNWDGKKTYSIKLKNLNLRDKQFNLGFLRGLFDTDGGIYKPKNKIAFGTASEALAIQIKEILEHLGLKPGFYKYKNKNFWYIDLYGKRTDSFMKLVSPHNLNKIIKRF